MAEPGVPRIRARLEKARSDRRHVALLFWPSRYDEDVTWLLAQRDAVLEVMDGYEDWYEDAPEDSWRFQRDLRAALGIE